MYQRILVPLEHSEYDAIILDHVRKLSRLCAGSSIVLIHVADGWAARNIVELKLRESEEMKDDREYIEGVADTLESEGFKVEALLADVLRGSVAHELRHISMLPVLMVRGNPAPAQSPSPS